jgi:hypothetical protein
MLALGTAGIATGLLFGVAADSYGLTIAATALILITAGITAPIWLRQVDPLSS